MNFHQPAWYFLWSMLTSGGFLFKLVVKGLVHLKMKISTFIVMSFLNIKKYLRRGHKNCVFVCLYIQKKESHTDFGMTWRWVNEDNFHVWVNWTTASKAQHIKLVINREEEWLAELWVIFKVACFFFLHCHFVITSVEHSLVPNTVKSYYPRKPFLLTSLQISAASV